MHRIDSSNDAVMVSDVQQESSGDPKANAIIGTSSNVDSNLEKSPKVWDPSQPAPLSSVPFACYKVGTFEDENIAQSYVGRISQYSVKTVIERQREEKQVYRVQTLFFANEKELLQYRELLSSAQFAGKLMKDDRGRYGLSLGLFYQEADAVFLFRRARQSGFSSIELKTLPEYYYSYNVKVMHMPGSTASVQKYLHSLVYPPTKPTVEKISCK